LTEIKTWEAASVGGLVLEAPAVILIGSYAAGVLAGFRSHWPDLNFTVAGFDMSASELNWLERVL